MNKFLKRDCLFKIAILADKDKNEAAYETAYHYHTKSCLTRKNKVKICEEDYTIIEPLVNRLDECTDEQCVGKLLTPSSVLSK